MRRTTRKEVWALSGSIAVLGLAVLACNRKDETTTVSSASVAPSATVAVPVAVTEVSRYPDEKSPSGAVETTVAKSDIVARATSSLSGKSVGTPTNGQKVTRIAERDGFVLVALDPSDVAKGQLGWVPAEALAGGAVAVATTTTAAQVKGPCKADEVLIGKKCMTTCRADMECDGTGADCVAVPGKSVRACLSTAMVADLEAQLLGEVAPTKGETCEAGWVFAESACHKPCAADGQCKPPTTYCKKWEGKRLCARTGSLVVPND